MAAVDPGPRQRGMTVWSEKVSETETKGRENVSVVGFVVVVGVVSVVGDLRTEKIEPKNILTRLLEFFFDPVSEKLNLFWIL